jgi:hypothetical protein
MFGQELLIALQRLDDLVARYPVRGLKGAVGTQLDQLTLLGGDTPRWTSSRRASSSTSASGLARRRRPGLPALARLRGRHRPAPGRRRRRELRHHAAPHGRAGPAHRGFPGGPGRLVRDAAQGQRPELRAHLRLLDDPLRLRDDDGEPRRPPVERGRRLLLGRAPRGAARRVLRDRRPARDLPHRPAPDGSLPGRHRGRERAQPALPRDHHDPHGGGQGRRRPRDRARGHQGARARRRQGAAHRRRRRSARPARRRQARRPRQEEAPGHPRRKRPLRRRRPASGGRLRRRGRSRSRKSTRARRTTAPASCCKAAHSARHFENIFSPAERAGVAFLSESGSLFGRIRRRVRHFALSGRGYSSPPQGFGLPVSGAARFFEPSRFRFFNNFNTHTSWQKNS